MGWVNVLPGHSFSAWGLSDKAFDLMVAKGRDKLAVKAGWCI